MNRAPMSAVVSVVTSLLNTNAKRATKYISDRLVVRATRRHKGSIEMVLSICKPNFAEREFIRLCKKAKEPFPMKRVILKFPVKRK